MTAWALGWPLLAALLAVPAARAAEVLPISLSVPGPHAAAYLPAEIIAAIGADRSEGARLRVTHVPGGGAALEDLLTGNADFAMLALPAAMSGRLKDSRVVALAAVNDQPLYALMVRATLKDKVRSVADLAGRTIGVHSNSITTKTNSHQMIELMLNHARVPLHSVRFVPVGQRWSTEMQMLKDGRADAIMGDEPHASRMAAEGIAFALAHLGDPETARRIPGSGFLRGVIVGRTDTVAADPRKAEIMVRVLRRTLQWIATHAPQEVVDSAGIQDAEERKYMLAAMQRYPRQYSRDARFSSRQLAETQLFFRFAQAGNAAAQALEIEAMVNDRWAGRRD